MSLYTEDKKQQQSTDSEQVGCQLGCGVSNIGSVLQPALDKFRDGLLQISGSVLRQMKTQRGAGVKRKRKNKSKKQRGSGITKKSGKRKQKGAGQIRKKAPSKRKPIRKTNF